MTHPPYVLETYNKNGYIFLFDSINYSLHVWESADKCIADSQSGLFKDFAYAEVR
jgi:hypothetical protein